MTIGEKLRAARLEAGLSQRQLCEGIVTRNMLSQIENGSAKPSLPTLQALAQRLHKGVQYFLEEAVSPVPQNRDEALITWALEDLSNGQPERAAHLLAAVETPGGGMWHLARGCLLTAQGEFSVAIGHLKQGEMCRPSLAQANLEICFRETGDFQNAYLYACKQRR